MISQDENFVGGRGEWGWGVEGGLAEGMKRISVRIIQSSSDYPPNMELCQVEAVVIVARWVSAYHRVEACTPENEMCRACVCVCCLL